MTESYVVEAILDTKVNEQGEPVHLVKWRGYPDSHNSWEPTSSFSTSGAAKKGSADSTSARSAAGKEGKAKKRKHADAGDGTNPVAAPAETTNKASRKKDAAAAAAALAATGGDAGSVPAMPSATAATAARAAARHSATAQFAGRAASAMISFHESAALAVGETSDMPLSGAETDSTLHLKPTIDLAPSSLSATGVPLNVGDTDPVTGLIVTPEPIIVSAHQIVCGTCSKMFVTMMHYNRHNRKHTGYKPHVCATCGQSFARSDNYDYHMRLHTGEKPYKCSACGKEFAHRSDVNKHLRIHTGVRPYMCDVCGAGFMAGVHLRRHKENSSKCQSEPKTDAIDDDTMAAE